MNVQSILCVTLVLLTSIVNAELSTKKARGRASPEILAKDNSIGTP